MMKVTMTIVLEIDRSHANYENISKETDLESSQQARRSFDYMDHEEGIKLLDVKVTKERVT